MNNLSKTKKIFIFITILTIAVIIFYGLFFYSIKEKNTRISYIKNDLDISLQKEIKLTSVKNLIKDTQENRLKLDTYFVADDEIIDFIETVEGLGVYSGVVVDVISVSIDDNKEIESKFSEVLNLNLEVGGKWVGVFQFLALLEKMPFKIDISSVKFQAIYDNDLEKNSSGVWKGFFNISVIKLK